jgi:hypothetical protein
MTNENCTDIEPEPNSDADHPADGVTPARRSKPGSVPATCAPFGAQTRLSRVCGTPLSSIESVRAGPPTRGRLGPHSPRSRIGPSGPGARGRRRRRSSWCSSSSRPP